MLSVYRTWQIVRLETWMLNIFKSLDYISNNILNENKNFEWLVIFSLKIENAVKTISLILML